MARGTKILNKGSKTLNQTGPGSGRIKSVPTNLSTRLKGSTPFGRDIGIRIRKGRRK